MKAMIAIVVSAVVLAIIIVVSLTNSDDLKRLQQLKNKRRFSGRRLTADEEQELNRLLVKYPWY